MLPLLGPDYLRMELDETRRRNEELRHAAEVRVVRGLRGPRKWRVGAQRDNQDAS
jgi:hypothetical protein